VTRRLLVASLTLGGAIFLAAADGPAGASAPVRSVPVSAVDTIGFTVSNMDRAVDFYTRVLTFEKESDVELAGRDYELLTGVFGARLRVVKLRLGNEVLELTEYLAQKGQSMPSGVRANDRVFQHAAIIVRDMDEAYARLRQFTVEHASTAPQRLPDWNPNAGGIRAFYFRDPDRHFLEILQFPPGKGLDRWHRSDRLFLGIDHTAIVTADTDQALRFYRDTLTMRVAGESTNYDIEQERLNGVFGARLRITTLRAAAGPGIELLEYLAPRDGHPAPADLHANDIAHWQTTLVTSDAHRLFDLLGLRLYFLVSPTAVSPAGGELGLANAVLVRDPDGHAMRLAAVRQLEH